MGLFISKIEGSDRDAIIIAADNIDVADKKARRYFTAQDWVKAGETVATTRIPRDGGRSSPNNSRPPRKKVG